MKKTIFSSAFFLILCLSLVSAQSRKLRVIAETANIHIEPYKSSMVIETVKKGTIFTLFDTGGKQKDWYYISFYQQDKWVTITGFVEAELVEEIGGQSQKSGEQKSEIPARNIPKKEKVPAKRPRDKKPATAEPEEKTVKAESQEKEVILLPFSGSLQVTSEEAVIRADADKTARIIRKIRQGELIVAVGLKGDWLRVKYSQEDGIVLIGFIFRDHVKVISGELPEKAEKEIAPEKMEEVLEKPVKPSERTKPKEAVEETRKRPGPEEAAQPGYLGEKPGTGGFILGIGIDAGYALPGESQYAGALKYGADVSFLVNRYLAVELSGFCFQSDIKGDVNALSKGKLSLTPVTLSIQGRYPLNTQFVPYIALGGGFYSIRFTLDSDIFQSWEDLGFDVSEEVKNSFGFHIGGGLDYYLTRDIAVRVDVRYLIVSTDGEWSQACQISGMETSGDINDISLNSLALGVGVKFQFRLF